MLAYFLAIIMAFKSITLLFNAFFSPKTHRKDDFLWSGLGLFYALILWLCATRFTGAVLLGQAAGVAITFAFMWENQSLRKAITANSDSNEILEGFSLLNFIGKFLSKISNRQKTPVMKVPESVTPKATPEVVLEQESTTSVAKEETLPQSQPTSVPSEDFLTDEQPTIQPEIISDNLNEEETLPQPQIAEDETNESSLITEDDNEQEEEEEEVNQTVVEKVTVIREEITLTTTPENSEAKQIEDIQTQTQLESEEEDFFADTSSTINESIDSQLETKPNFFSRIVNVFRKPKTKTETTKTISTNKSKPVEKKVEKQEPTLSKTDSLNDRVIINEVEEFSSENTESVSEIEPQTSTEEVEEAIEKQDLSDTIVEKENDIPSTEFDSVNIEKTTVDTTATEDISTDTIEQQIQTQPVEENTSIEEETVTDELPLANEETQTNIEELVSPVEETQSSISDVTTNESSIEFEKQEQDNSQTSSVQNEDEAVDEDEVIVGGIEITVEQDLEPESVTTKEEEREIPSQVKSDSQIAENVPSQDIVQSLNDLPSTVEETNPWLDNQQPSPVTETKNDDTDDDDDDIESLAKLFEDNDNNKK